jgi:phosphoribosylformylglycinamidine synthase subunit PurQ / glutaminase
MKRTVPCRWGVIVFPGTNCDVDTHHVLTRVMGQEAAYVWHEETDLRPYDAIVLPGGFAHGDYLRAGAIARFSPVMAAVREFAAAGKPVLGICNGFQVLVEAGLLPGAMMRNAGLRFICRFVNLRVENDATPFTRACRTGQVLRLPIAHNEGSYFCEPDELRELERHGQILFRYCEPDGAVTPAANPNGSVANIAGICSAAGNVMGLMPHPERASEVLLGSDDGRCIFESLLPAWTGAVSHRRGAEDAEKSVERVAPR